MTTRTRSVLFAVNTLLSISIILAAAFFLSGWSVFIKAVCYFLGTAGVFYGAVTFALKKDGLFKSGFVLVVCAFAIIGAVALLSGIFNLNDYKTDGEKIDMLTNLIKGTGSWGMALYVLIQVLQVVILPLPAAVCYVPGSVIWGPFTATLLASIGVVIGSVAAYFIGRIFGKRVVIWIAGKEACEKYTRIIGNRGKVIFVLMQILPFFPDDILCLVAGLTSMSFPFFLIVMVLVRPFVIAAYCYLGSGAVIPFGGWGIPVWIAIFAVCIALAVLSFKYQDRVEKWLVSKFKKNSENQTEEREDK